jgi:drug/metabolite transporter (DMT)-like permease
LCLGQAALFVAWVSFEGAHVENVSTYAGLAAASVALNVVANLAYLYAVRVSPFSVVIPMLSFVPVFTVAAAHPLLGELPTHRQLVGIAVVVAGALALGAAQGSESTDAGPLDRVVAMVRGLARERGALFMLVTAICWAMTMVVDKMAMTHAPVGLHGMNLNLGVGVVLIVWMAVRGRLGELRQIRGNEGVLAGAVAAATVGLGGQLLAVQYLLAGVVEAIKRAIGIVVAVFAGRLVFRESLSAAKLVAVVLMSIGTALIVV